MTGPGSPIGTSPPLVALITLANAIAGGRGAGSGRALVGIGWATVELDRAERELTAILAPEGLSPFEPAPSDGILGAFCRTASLPDGGPRILLLEPSTEGRLAAFLARSGEGVSAVYLGPAGSEDAVPGTSGMPGPIGLARLVAGGRAGPYVILVSAQVPTGNSTVSRDTIAS